MIELPDSKHSKLKGMFIFHCDWLFRTTLQWTRIEREVHLSFFERLMMKNYRMILYLHHNVIANNDINERFSILGDTKLYRQTDPKPVR